MSRGLQGWTPALRPDSVVRTNRIFPTDTARQMLAVHLFFVKAFGCVVVEAGGTAKIDVQSLAAAIRGGRAHPNIYLGIGIPQHIAKGPIVSASDLTVVTPDGSSHGADLATWFYNVNGICITVVYAPDMAAWARNEGLWHPRDGSGRFVVKDFAWKPPL